MSMFKVTVLRHQYAEINIVADTDAEAMKFATEGLEDGTLGAVWETTLIDPIEVDEV